jgi:CRISPR-associated protein Cas1
VATYYVREQGATIRKHDQRLVVTRDDKVLAHIPLHDLTQLVVMHDVQVTTQALLYAARAGVDVVYMTRGGGMPLRVVGNESGFAELRLRQMQAMSDPATCLYLARQVVFGKVSLQLNLLRRAAGSEPTRHLPPAMAGIEAAEPVAAVTRGTALLNQRPYAAALKGIGEMLNLAGGADSMDGLRGYEGKAAAWYWPAFKLLLSDNMGFANRVYHPPTDPINALLSFGYAMLQKEVAAATHIVGFDPYIGFFHTVQRGRPSLTLDLMEEFRAVLVDPLVIRLVNLGMMKRRDFVRTGDEDRPVRMTDEALKRVIVAYEERVNTKMVYRFLEKPEETTWRRCVLLQAQQLARVVRGEKAQYEPISG